jgi:hypothetical protein
MMKRMSYAWTAQEEARLCDLAEQGVHLRSIAIRLRRSESSIKKRALDRGLKLKKPPRTRFRIDEMLKSRP